MVAASLCLALFAAITRHLSTEGLNVYVMVALLEIIAFIILVPWFIKIGMWMPKTTRLGLYIKRSVVGLTSFLLWIYAISKAPIPYVTAINFTAPLFTVLLAVIIFKEKNNRYRTIALFFGFIGALVVIRPFTEAFHYAALIMVISSFLRGFINVMIKQLTTTDSAITILFYSTFVFAVISLPLAILFWQEMTYEQWAWVTLMGIISNIYLMSLSKAYVKTDLSVVMPFDFTQLVFASIIAYFIFGEVVALWTIVGSAIILASGTIAVHYERKWR